MSFDATRSASFDVRRLKSSYGTVKITDELREYMTKLWKESTQEFVKAVAKRMLTMDTGMSKASLIPLARQVRALTALRNNFGSHVSERKGAWDIYGIYHKDWVRDVRQGERLGEKSFEYKVPPTKKRMVFHFAFEINVYQYLLHDRGYKHSEAWQTLVAGRAAFKAHYDANFDEYVRRKIARKKFSNLF